MDFASTSSHIIGRFWLGGEQFEPPANISLLVLCAREIKKPPPGYQGDWFYYGFDDVEGDITALQSANILSAQVHHWCQHNDGNVLVTCLAGQNRSALTLGLTLVRQGLTPEEAYKIITKQRERTFSNPDFARWMRSPPPVKTV